jgi:hypothetical protein
MIFNTSASATHATEDGDNRSQSLPPIERAATVVTAAIDGGKLRARRADKLTVLLREDRSEIAHDLVELARRPSESVRSPSSSGEETVKRLHLACAPKLFVHLRCSPVNRGFGRRNPRTACSRGDVNIHLKTADEKAIGHSTSDSTVYKPRSAARPRTCGALPGSDLKHRARPLRFAEAERLKIADTYFVRPRPSVQPSNRSFGSVLFITDQSGRPCRPRVPSLKRSFCHAALKTKFVTGITEDCRWAQ